MTEAESSTAEIDAVLDRVVARIQATMDGDASAVTERDALTDAIDLTTVLAVSGNRQVDLVGLTTLAFFHLSRAGENKDPEGGEDWDVCVALYARLTQLDPALVPEQIRRLLTPDVIATRFDLAWSQRGRAAAQNAIGDDSVSLDPAVAMLARAVVLAAPDDPAIPERLANLGTALHLRAERTGSTDDLAMALHALARCVRLTGGENPGYLVKLASAQRTVYELVGDAGWLRSSIATFRKAIGALPPDHWYFGAALSNTALVLGSVSKMTVPDPDLLDDAVRLGQLAAAQPEPHPVVLLLALRDLYHRRFEHAGALADLDRAISLGLSAAAEEPGARAWGWLGGVYAIRHRRTQLLDDVEESVRYLGKAAGSASGSDAGGYLAALCASFTERFAVSDDPADLDHAIAAANRGLSTVDLEDETRRMLHGVRAEALVDRHLARGEERDLTDALAEYERAQPAPGDANPSIAAARQLRHRLGRALAGRYWKQGHTDDLTRAIEELRAARSQTAPGEEFSVELAMEISWLLRLLYQRLGQPEDAEAALAVGWEAAGSAAAPPRLLGWAMLNLGVLYELRYDRTDHHDDLDRAVDRFRAAAELLGDDIECLCSLGGALRKRAERDNDESGAVAAVDVLRRARALSADQRFPARALSNLAAALQTWWEFNRDPAQLDEAIAALRESVTATESVHTQRAEVLLNLMGLLLVRSREPGGGDDLQAALDVQRILVELVPPGHPMRARVSLLHAEALGLTYARTGHPDDAERAATELRSVALDGAMPPWERVEVALRWAGLAESSAGPAAALAAFDAALAALRTAIGLGSARDDKERQLATFIGLPGVAAACAIRAGSAATAVTFMERGRAVLWSQLLDRQSEIDSVGRVAPGLAARLVEIRAELTALERSTAAGHLDGVRPDARLAVPPVATAVLRR